jgi:hypothetical protein
MGRSIRTLEEKRRTYVGGELTMNFSFEELPDEARRVVLNVSGKDKKKGLVLHRYYSELTRSMREMLRVLKPDRAAIIVVGSSTMRSESTETERCLTAIGRSMGLEVAGIGVRNLDRNRRMLPAGASINSDSQIEQRMHSEYVIGLYKPAKET